MALSTGDTEKCCSQKALQEVQTTSDYLQDLLSKIYFGNDLAWKSVPVHNNVLSIPKRIYKTGQGLHSSMAILKLSPNI